MTVSKSDVENKVISLLVEASGKVKEIVSKKDDDGKYAKKIEKDLRILKPKRQKLAANYNMFIKKHTKKPKGGYITNKKAGKLKTVQAVIDLVCEKVHL